LFSFASPKEVSKVYTRIFHPETGVVPRPERIVQDANKALRAMTIIHGAKGAFVPGLAGGRVPGHRHCATKEKRSNNHGGKRDKLSYNLVLKEQGMHADLKLIQDDPKWDVTGMFRLQVDE